MEFLPSVFSLYIILYAFSSAGNILFFALLLLHNRFKVPWVATDDHYSLHSKLKCSFHCQSVVRLNVFFFLAKGKGKLRFVEKGLVVALNSFVRRVPIASLQMGENEGIFERGA
jgi:hypothetical protein